MTNYIKFTPAHLGDSRWLEVGAEAFAVHAWALDYSNTMLLDGEIAKAMALRVALPVPPDRTQPAIDALLDAGLWQDLGTKYLIVNYGSHALSADEIQATRERWAKDKRRRRLHGNGLHDECDPAKCRGAMSHADSPSDSLAESLGESSRKTRPDKTRPDQTFRSGSGAGADEPAPADAGRVDGDAYPSHRFVAAIDDTEHCGLCGLPRNEEHLGATA